MERRVFLKHVARWAVRAGGLALLLPALDACHRQGRGQGDAGGPTRASPKGAGNASAAGTAHLKVLTAAEAVTLEAMLERLLPSNVPKGTPGAKEAHVLRYVDGQLTDPHFHAFRPLVRGGVHFLDLVARHDHHLPFARLAAEGQDEILRRFQVGRIPVRFPVARFFEVIRVLSLEGFLGDPKHGGNAGGIVWDSIGFDPDSCGVKTP